MIKLSYEQIIEKIKEKSGLSDAEINIKIKEKLDTLSGLVSRDGAAHILANECGINLYAGFSGRVQINKIIPGMRDVEVVGRVQNIYDVKNFNTSRGEGKVGSFFIADETGAIRVTCWHAATNKMGTIKTDDIVKIKNAYVRDNQGKLEVHVGERAEILINPLGETVGEVVSARVMNKSNRKKIADLNENDSNVELLAYIVQTFDIRFFEVCPECNKRMRQREESFVCEVHGTIIPAYSYVMNCFIDDGSGNIRAVFFREQVEQLMSKPREEVLQYKEFTERFAAVKQELLGQIIKLSGRVTKNSMFDRLEFVARTVDVNPDPEDEILRLNAEPRYTVEKSTD